MFFRPVLGNALRDKVISGIYENIWRKKIWHNKLESTKEKGHAERETTESLSRQALHSIAVIRGDVT
jgi:hypothetical protein